MSEKKKKDEVNANEAIPHYNVADYDPDGELTQEEIHYLLGIKSGRIKSKTISHEEYGRELGLKN